MNFSLTAEYAIRAVVWLAQNPSQSHTTRELAENTHVSMSYLPKVLQPLGKAQIVNSQRGIYGGYRLGVSPKELTVLDVVNCVDPINRIKVCPHKSNPEDSVLCPLHKLIDDSIADTERRFAATTFNDLISDNEEDKKICGFKERYQ